MFFRWSPVTLLHAYFMPQLQSAVQSSGLAVSGKCPPGQVCAVLALMFRVSAWDLYGEWRFHVTLFLGPSILQAPGEGFPLGGSHFQGCHQYLPSGYWLLLPANHLGTSSQAHPFVMWLNVFIRQCFFLVSSITGGGGCPLY